MDAFISHSSLDKDIALRLERGLAGEGVSAWVDRKNIRAGGLLVSDCRPHW
jgi:hypothetical protein